MQANTVAILPSTSANMIVSGLRVPYLDVNHSTAPNLPPDPDNMNDLRAQRADDAVVISEGSNSDDINLQTLSDLLSRIGHWCDRNSLQMADALRMAAASYSDETAAKGRQFGA